MNEGGGQTSPATKAEHASSDGGTGTDADASPAKDASSPAPPADADADGKPPPTTGEPAAAATGGGDDVPAAVSPDDLASLVAAVKFAHPDYGARRVHREIAEVASRGEPVLSSVRLGDVKRVWKRMGLSDHAQQSTARGGAKSSPAGGGGKAGAGKKGAGGKKVAPAQQQKSGKGAGLADLAGDSDVVKMYTVGDASVRRVAEEYNAKAAARAAAEAEAMARAAARDRGKGGGGEGGGGCDWVHFFLDVPADRSGQKPHQALINFSDNNNGGAAAAGSNSEGAGSTDRAAAGGDAAAAAAGTAPAMGTPRSSSSLTNGGAATSSSGTPITGTSSSSSTSSPPRTILKIQVAGGIGAAAQDAPPTPMLLYNADRTARTFLHPDDGEGYEKIRALVTSNGHEGALGRAGGLKGYFYGRIRSVAAAPPAAEEGGKASPSSALAKKKKASSSAAGEGGGGGRIVSIDCSGLAPDQAW